jgi:uncharacterized protein (DUF2267 family)
MRLPAEPPDHNFSTDTAIQDVAKAFWKNVDTKLVFDCLSKLPEEAFRFWNHQ